MSKNRKYASGCFSPDVSLADGVRQWPFLGENMSSYECQQNISHVMRIKWHVLVTFDARPVVTSAAFFWCRKFCWAVKALISLTAKDVRYARSSLVDSAAVWRPPQMSQRAAHTALHIINHPFTASEPETSANRSRRRRQGWVDVVEKRWGLGSHK